VLLARSRGLCRALATFERREPPGGQQDGTSELRAQTSAKPGSRAHDPPASKDSIALDGLAPGLNLITGICRDIRNQPTSVPGQATIRRQSLRSRHRRLLRSQLRLPEARSSLARLRTLLRALDVAALSPSRISAIIVSSREKNIAVGMVAGRIGKRRGSARLGRRLMPFFRVHPSVLLVREPCQ
jgi:hypothetical protein